MDAGMSKYFCPHLPHRINAPERPTEEDYLEAAEWLAQKEASCLKCLSREIDRFLHVATMLRWQPRPEEQRKIGAHK